MSDIKVSQKISTIGRPEAQRKILRGLGLRGIGSTVVVKNTPSFRGMIKKVLHLVEVQEAKS
jgi:large subunit ribosomal protein L30